MSAKRPRPKAPRPAGDAPDSEGRALWADPEFRKAIEAGRAGPFTPLDESNRQAGVTAEELATADAELDRLLAEEDGAPTPGNGKPATP
jgi:hypothetical protein